MSGNRGNRGRRRPRSPCYCDTSVAALNVAEDTIRQLQTALEEEQRMSAALRQERDDAQNNARIHERDLVVLRADHRRLQDNFGRLTTRFADLAYRIQADHPEFQVFRLPGRRS
jgi:FtsZ-binding cell division protein ZapB